jgi:serine/threonine protein kinase
VAIKVLPDATARDPHALARFEREAKAVASLSHPHILAVYDVGRHEDISYIVMELLEGETLRSRINRSALASRKAIEIGIAIADGLCAAHAKGVIHRDLKPENIFLTTEGHVKILDFGLARSTSPAGGAKHDPTSSPTLTIETRHSAIIGTLCYMAPEQIRALATDGRTDIFAFGCVLYEMLTGRRAFLGETAADTMTSVLKEEPISVRKASSGVGLELERLIDRCLEKRPGQRFQTASDLAFSLRAIQSHSDHAPASSLELKDKTMTTAESGTVPAAVRYRLLLRHPRGLQVDEQRALENAIQQAVIAQQDLARRFPSVRMIEDLRIDEGGFWVLETPGDAQDFESLLADPRPPPEIVDYGIQLCDALIQTCYPTAGGVQPHGAIRSLCVSVDNGRVMVSDFGLAATVARTVAPSAVREEIEVLAPYVAPELWRNPSAFGELRDLYAVGVLLYELATGTHPYGVNRHDYEDCERIFVVENRPAAKANPSLPPGLAHVLDVAVSKREQARFPSFTKLREVLQTCLDGRTSSTLVAPAQAAHVDRLPSAVKPVVEPSLWWRRRRAVAITSLAAVLAVIVLVVIWPRNQLAGPCAGFEEDYQSFRAQFEARDHTQLDELRKKGTKVKSLAEGCLNASPSADLKEEKAFVADAMSKLEDYDAALQEFEGVGFLDLPKAPLKAQNTWATDYAQKLREDCETFVKLLDEMESRVERRDVGGAKEAWDQAKKIASASDRKEKLGVFLDERKKTLLQSADKQFSDTRKVYEQPIRDTSLARKAIDDFLLIGTALLDIAGEEQKPWQHVAKWKKNVEVFSEAMEAAQASTTLRDMQTSIDKANQAWPKSDSRGLVEKLKTIRARMTPAQSFYEQADWPAAGQFLDQALESGREEPTHATMIEILGRTRDQWVSSRIGDMRGVLDEAKSWLLKNAVPTNVIEQLRAVDAAAQARFFLDRLNILPPAAGDNTLDGLVPVAAVEPPDLEAIALLRNWTRAEVLLDNGVALPVRIVPGRGELIYPFWLSETELTLEQHDKLAHGREWPKDVLGNTRCQDMRSNPRHPASCLASTDISRLLLAFNEKSPFSLRLPSPKEWTWALKADKDSVLAANPRLRTIDETGTITFDPTKCNFASLESMKKGPAPPGTGSHSDGFAWYAPVAEPRYPTNRWGFHDMLGNVREATQEGNQFHACGGSCFKPYPTPDEGEHCSPQLEPSRWFEEIGFRIVASAE